jgi:heat shock protein HtpX
MLFMSSNIVTFRDLIARNKRASFWLVVGFVLFNIALAVILGIAFIAMTGGYSSSEDIRIGIIIGAIAAVVATLISSLAYFEGDSLVLGVAGAQELEPGEDQELRNVVEEIAIAAGVPPPKIYLIHDQAMNAFATGRDPKHASVAITTGLREKLTRDELQGVLAHEMGHVRNFDIRLMLLTAVLIGVVVMLSDFFWRALRTNTFWGGSRRSSRSSSSKDGAGLIIAIIIIVALILSLIAPILAQIIQMAVSRQREYLADATAVELTRNPYGLASALRKLEGDPNPLQSANRGIAHLFIVNPIKKFSDLSETMFSSHPPIQERIKRLEALTA